MRAKTRLADWSKGTAIFRRARVRSAPAALLVLALSSTALTAIVRRVPTTAEAGTRVVSGGAGSPTQDSAGTLRSDALAQKFDRLVEEASARGSARVIVGLRSDFTPEGHIELARKEFQRTDIGRRQDALLRRLEPHTPQSVRRFKSIPYVALTVSAEALEALRASGEVESVREDRLNRASLAHSTKAVDAPAAWQKGFSGQGQAVAILDSGVEKSHPFLSGKVIAEACFSTNYAPGKATSMCPGGVEESTAPDSGLPCNLGTEKCDHGTHVAGIAAGRSPSGDMQGVAKDAGIVAIQVNSRIDDADTCKKEGSAPCARVYDSDYMLALEYVLGLKENGTNVAAANLSFGSDEYARSCDEEFRDIKRLIDNLQSSGVATVVASGNDGAPNALGVPACVSSAISVGAVGDGGPDEDGEFTSSPDVIWDLSNRARFLTLLAPGELVYSSSLNGDYETYDGTSMAAPHVAGAWAVLKQHAPNLSVAQVLAALKNTGKPVAIGNGNAVPRIQVHAAMQALFNCGYSLTLVGRSVAASGDIGSFGVVAPAGCPWNATSGADWISTTGGGSGSGTVSFTVAVNTGAARAGNIYAGGQTFVVEQAAGGGDSAGQFRLAAPTGQPKDLFGRSVAISGETAVVGMPYDNIGENINQGSAYVFVRNASGMWIQQARLTAFDAGADDEFGWSVAIEGDTLVVGARSHAVGSRVNQGAAYVYVRSGAAWTLQAKLVSEPDTSFGVVDDHFGEAVAISGNRIVVGSPGFETFSSLNGVFRRGGVYIFNRSGTTWTRRDPPLWGDFNERMGLNLATADFTLQGTPVSVILVGNADASPGSIAGAPPSDYGAVKFFVRSSGPIEWVESRRVYAKDFTHGNKFGWSVAFAADGTVVVGSPADDTGQTTDHGSAYILVPTLGAGGVTWTEQAKLTASDAGSFDEFGRSVGISGNTVIVGAPSDTVGGKAKQGSAYIFERAGSTWTQKRKLLAEGGESLDEFGTSVGFSQGTALVGAASEAVEKGSAYIFGPQFISAASTVQFSSATHNVDEPAGKVTLTVNRTGSTALAASVDFASADGASGNVADRRKDYTQTLGTLHFAPGETSKTVTVFIADDVLPEQPETFTVSLSDAAGAALGEPSSTTVVINSNDAAAGPNPVDPNSFNPEFFVRQHYVDFLNREPDATGLAFWTGNFTECAGNQQCLEAKRINVSAAFFLSIEFQETGYLVYRFYKAAYGDSISSRVAGTVPVVRLDEFQPDTRSIGEGVQVGVGNWERLLENNKVAYALAFVQRPRFLAAYPVTMSPAQFVDGLNLRAGGVLSPAERQQLVAELTANNTTQGRAHALRKVAEDVDLRVNEFRRAFVLMQYFGYLRRNPDDPQDTDFRGWTFWLDKLNQFNGDFVRAEMVKAFISSTEYKNRFGQ